MDLETLRSFFLGCTILNAALLLLSFGFWLCAADWIYRIHGRLFPMSRETFNVAMYSFFGAMELVVLMFNLVPYLALLIVG